MKKLKAVILAGGAGTRLKPLTCDTPKPLIPVCGSPCIYYILNLLKTHGIDEACITLQYKGAEIERAVKNTEELSLHFVTENEPLGTAGSVSNCKKFIDGEFLVICGDCICDFNLTEATEFHRKHGGLATVILTKVKEPLEYGVAVTNESNKIVRFIEKPSWSRVYSDTVNTGIYIFSKEIFNYIPENEFCDFSKDVFPKLLENGIGIYGYLAKGYWCDIGNISSYMNCTKDILDGKLKFQANIKALARNNSLNTNAVIKDPVFIGDNLSADGTIIGPYSVIGRDCVLGKNVRIENSILFDGVTMEEGSSARNCIICKNAVLKNGVSVGEHCVIGADSEIGKDVIISAGAKIYPKNIIPEYTFIKSSVIDGLTDINLENGRIILKTDKNRDNSVLLKIGTAFASVIKKDIAIGIDPNNNSKDLMSSVLAICSGIMSAATGIFDLGECDINIFSYAVREYGFGGGLHIGEEQDNTVLTLLDRDGLPFGREKERSFESAFTSGEFEPVKSGDFRSFKGVEKIYEKRFSEKIETLEPVYAFVSAPNFILKNLNTKQKKENSEYIYIMPHRLIVQTKDREAYDDDLIKCVTAFCCGMNEGEVFIPYNYPTAVDAAAKKYGFRCKRLTLEDKDRVKLYKMTDTYYRALCLLNFMAKHGLTFGEIAKSMPVFTSRRREIEVTADKATIMRALSAVKGRELVEGVRIRESGGTVLIIPQKIKNAFSICAESEDSETAAELCDFYAKKLKK